MRLTVLGASPAWPNPGGAHSGYLLEHGGRRLLLDCGPGVLANLREREEWPSIDAIAITHFHLDHWGDLVPWVWGSRHRGGVTARPELWVYAGGRASLEALGSHLGSRDMFDWAFVVNEYEEDRPFTAAEFGVEAVRLPHYALETYGFRVTSGNKTLAYSGDSAPSERLARLARDADLFVCEATLLSGTLDSVPRGHLSLDESVAAFAASGARRLLITHRPSELPVPKEQEVAFDGMMIDLGS